MCQRVEAALRGEDPRLVHAFPHSVLLVGDHQRFEGYCVLVSRSHAREPFELPSPAREDMLSELLRSAEAIQAAFGPWKMNYSCYGNQVPHVHWHLFPRSDADPQRLLPPWSQSDRFEAHATTDTQARAVAERVRRGLLMG